MTNGERTSDPSSKRTADPDLADLVAKLPEVYQPIFAHPELSGRAVRDCEGRLGHITRIYRALEAELNRPLRVLDLGCAQGYFSFALARLGAAVVGFDFVERNVAVCKALATEHPDLHVRFETGRVEEAIVRVRPDLYDLVLGLSVFHHLVHQLGVGPVQRMFHTLADTTRAGVFELALNCEPLFWAIAQPRNPKELLEPYAFVHELARHPSHLSPVDRPLYVASNFYCFLDDRAEAFHSWQAASEEFITVPVRRAGRCFFADGHVVKLFSLDEPTDVMWRDRAPIPKGG